MKNKTDFACIWSGGKDACLAMYRLIQAGYKVEYLVTMMEADGQLSRAHALPLHLLQTQAKALGLPLLAQPADDYKKAYLEALAFLKTHDINNAVFGDIDLQAHRDWQEEIGEIADFNMLFPLWEEAHEKLVYEFIDAGFKTVIIAVKEDLLDDSFLGKRLDKTTIKNLEDKGVDICGEDGEFHTFVIDGPIFSHEVAINQGGIFSKNGYRFLSFN